jgi:hypothetical protein
MQIILRDKRSEAERRKKEDSLAILRRYYEREIRDGTRMKMPIDNTRGGRPATKEKVKRLYEER